MARHVAGTHHVVAQVVRGRPDADFGLFGSLEQPAKGDPSFPNWFADGTASLVQALRDAPAGEPCWSWYDDGRQVGFWSRRMAHETLVHRWDAEAGAGIVGPAMDPAIAADAVDEYLDVFVPTTRALQSAPAGPSFRFLATDTGGDWQLELPEPGRSVVGAEPVDAAVELRGTAEGLLLVAWGRLAPEAAGVEVLGDGQAWAKRAELLPPM